MSTELRVFITVQHFNHLEKLVPFFTAVLYYFQVACSLVSRINTGESHPQPPLCSRIPGPTSAVNVASEGERSYERKRRKSNEPTLDAEESGTCYMTVTFILLQSHPVGQGGSKCASFNRNTDVISAQFGHRTVLCKCCRSMPVVGISSDYQSGVNC